MSRRQKALFRALTAAKQTRPAGGAMLPGEARTGSFPLTCGR